MMVLIIVLSTALWSRDNFSALSLRSLLVKVEYIPQYTHQSLTDVGIHKNEVFEVRYAFIGKYII